MDAKLLHEFLASGSLFLAPKRGHYTEREMAKVMGIILSALSLAAAVEGPPDSTPETDAAWADDKGHRFQVSASLECRMLNALRALKAERERAVSDAVRDVLAERERQQTVEGWTPEHDDKYQHNELSKAAACYAFGVPRGWPWLMKWWKPSDYRRNLVKAGALTLAEIERLDRAALAAQEGRHD